MIQRQKQSDSRVLGLVEKVVREGSPAAQLAAVRLPRLTKRSLLGFLALAIVGCAQEPSFPFDELPEPPRFGTVYGFATDSAGAPASATVELRPDLSGCPEPDQDIGFGGFLASATTDSTGRYRVVLLVVDTIVSVVCFRVVAAPRSAPDDTVVVRGGRLPMTSPPDSVRVDVRLR